MTKELSDSKYRIFIIGAGFSRPAGLPLASSLFQLVKHEIERRYGKDTKFHRDVDNFIEYQKKCGMWSGEFDLEQFLSYLDIEHHLKLRGSDTWSIEGNETQLLVRKSIGYIINKATPNIDKIPKQYFQFAEKICTTDLILTFNYDLILEKVFSHVGIPFRRFPERYKSIGHSSNVVDNDVEEVTLLKMHGSIDWFDDRSYLESIDSLRRAGISTEPSHGIFANRDKYQIKPLVDGPLHPENSLNHIHTIVNIDEFYNTDRDFNAPFILSPSHVKFVYANLLSDFWYGLNRFGRYNFGMSVIGFSLPKHDEYIRVILYNLISNYTANWNEKFLEKTKDYIRFVDFKNQTSDKMEYIKNYGFSDHDKTLHSFDGFNEDSENFLFNQQRK